MEAFGVVVARPIPYVSGGGTGVEPQPHNASLSGLFCRAAVGTQRTLRASRKSLKVSTLSNFVFSDQSYLDYYSSGGKIRCGPCKEKVKGEKEMKKRLKMLKGLSRDLVVLSQISSDPDNVLVDPLKAKMISEAAELLQGQLQQLWSEEKELKQRRKEEKSRLKAAQMQKRLELQMSSSTSSESSESDSDCEQVVNMNVSNCKPWGKQIADASQPIPEKETLALPGALNDFQASVPKMKTSDSQSAETQGGNSAVGRSTQICWNSGRLEQEWLSGIRNTCGDGASNTPAATDKKIEVCMGGKCKKSGAAALMEEFQRALGLEAAVSGCKCMGKCREGPNVRISSNNFDEGIQAVVEHDRLKPATNHLLCLGVGLEDVDLIVDNILGGGNQRKLDLAAAS